MERLTKRFDGWVMREGCHGPCRTCNEAKCADIFPMIDRLADYEDTELTPEEVAEYQHLCETYVEAGLDSKFVQVCINATKRGVTIEQIMKLGSSNDPLTLEELQGMGGEPVWCLEMRCWGIIKLETMGKWAGMPFLIGTLHDRGVAVDFEYDVVKRELTLYRYKPEEETM